MYEFIVSLSMEERRLEIMILTYTLIASSRNSISSKVYIEASSKPAVAVAIGTVLAAYVSGTTGSVLNSGH